MLHHKKKKKKCLSVHLSTAAHSRQVRIRLHIIKKKKERKSLAHPSVQLKIKFQVVQLANVVTKKQELKTLPNKTSTQAQACTQDICFSA